MANLKSITVVIEGDSTPRTFKGRDAWALDNLINAGSKGCTPIDHPGPRWSHYVFKLRRGGVGVITHDEKHAGPYAGPKPLSLGMGRDMDQAFKVLPGQFVVVTGIPNHGKSRWLDQAAATMSDLHGWRWAVFSPETGSESHIIDAGNGTAG